MRSVSSPQPELELVVLKSFKPIVGSGGDDDRVRLGICQKKVIK